MLFAKKGFICILEKDIHEPIELFIERGNFIVSQQPKSKVEYDYYEIYSKIMINIKYNKCEYNDEIMNELCVMNKKIYDS